MLSVSSGGKQTNVTRIITFCSSTVGGDQIGEYDMATTCVKLRLWMTERKGYLRSTCRFCGPGSSVGIATELRVGRCGDRIPVGGEIFRTCPARPWGPPSHLYNGYRVFTGGKVKSGRGVTLNPHSLLVPFIMKEWSYTSTPPMGRTACTELQCLYKGDFYILHVDLRVT
jgi:hypothetical protein